MSRQPRRRGGFRARPDDGNDMPMPLHPVAITAQQEIYRQLADLAWEVTEAEDVETALDLSDVVSGIIQAAELVKIAAVNRAWRVRGQLKGG